MIIFGRSAVLLKSKESVHTVCPSCETKGSLVYSIYSRHAHVFWIPLFPAGKTGGAICRHCQLEIESKEMPEDLKREYDDFNSEVRAPIWQFAGLAIIAAFIIYINVSRQQDAKIELQYINSPKVGDIYQYKIENGRYSSFKIEKVFDESVEVALNDYETDQIGGLKEIDQEENYLDLIYIFSIEELKEMHNNGEIFDINRK